MVAEKNKKIKSLISESLKIANDLCYDEKTKAAIRNAETEGDIQRAMISGRNRKEYM